MTEHAIATECPTYYAVLVKGQHGRKWFRADSSSCGDRDFMQQMVNETAELYSATGLRFRLGSGEELRAPIAPVAYRPWAADDDETEDDVDIDSLSDDEL